MTTAVYRSSAGSADSSSTTQDITVPAGVQNTDVVLLVFSWSTNTTDETPPTASATGFNITIVPATTYNNMGFAVLARVGGLNPTDTITATLSAARLFRAKAHFYHTANAIPIIGTPDHRAGVSQNNQTAPAITTTKSGQTVAFIAAERSPAGATTVSSSPYTQRDYDDTTTGSTTSQFLSDTDQAVAGSTGTQQITYSLATGNGVAVQIAFDAPSLWTYGFDVVIG